MFILKKLFGKDTKESKDIKKTIKQKGNNNIANIDSNNDKENKTKG